MSQDMQCTSYSVTCEDDEVEGKGACVHEPGQEQDDALGEKECVGEKRIGGLAADELDGKRGAQKLE